MNEQRKSKRYELKLTLELMRGDSFASAESCETRNLSTGGVLFRSSQPVEIGDLIEYRITLPRKSPQDHAVMLHCRGKVLRRQPNGNGASHIAATLERYEFIRSKGAKR